MPTSSGMGAGLETFEGSPRRTWAERDRWPNAGNGGLRACKARQGKVWRLPFCGFGGATSCPHEP
jgi:hypothetical protein